MKRPRTNLTGRPVGFVCAEMPKGEGKLLYRTLHNADERPLKQRERACRNDAMVGWVVSRRRAAAVHDIADCGGADVCDITVAVCSGSTSVAWPEGWGKPE